MKLYIYFDGQEDTYSYRELTDPKFIPEFTKVLEFRRRLAVSCIHYRLRFLSENGGEPYTWLFGDVMKGGNKEYNFSTWFNERFGNWLDTLRDKRISEFLTGQTYGI